MRDFANAPPDLDEFRLRHDGTLDPRMADRLRKAAGQSVDVDRSILMTLCTLSFLRLGQAGAGYLLMW